MTVWPFVFTSLVVGWVLAVPWLLATLLSSLVGLVSHFSTLQGAHMGYLQWVSAFLKYPISFWISSGLLQTVFALCVSVFITLCLAERRWWLSCCRYWSVQVGFLYAVIDSLPSASDLTMVSKKGMALSSLMSSTGTLWLGQHYWCVEGSLYVFFPLDNPSVIHIPEPYFRGGWQYLMFFAQSTPCRGYQGPHSLSFYLFIK